jgi:hypothetical protein
VSFQVAPGTPLGPVTVTIVPFDLTTGGGTVLTDVNGNPLTSDEMGNTITTSLNNGTILVTAGAAVPEPSTLLLAGIGGGLFLARLWYVGGGRRGEATGS